MIRKNQVLVQTLTEDWLPQSFGVVHTRIYLDGRLHWLGNCRLIAVSIGYALILGFAIEGSELAAILGWGILRGVLRAFQHCRKQHQPDHCISGQWCLPGIVFGSRSVHTQSNQRTGICC